MMKIVIDLPRIESRRLVEVLTQAGYEVEQGPGLSPTGEALVTVRRATDPDVVKALATEHAHPHRITVSEDL